ncbi:hypothetical protein [Luteolibacter soli]|uniref:Uncharacterized protein n=1 Tax=Luteolibacter soli TaxID=3135280 RepID=A0ABU9AVE8_9BACT
MIGVSVSAEGLVEMERVVGELGDGRKLLEAAAAGVERRWRGHLEERYVPRDRDGVDFWGRVVRSMRGEVSESGAVVRVEEVGVRLRYEGGVVVPGKGISSYTGRATRALAIPSGAVPVREGRRISPREAGPLVFVKGRGGETVGCLLEGEVSGVISRGKNKGRPRVRRKGGVMFTLVMRQVIRGDAGILPSGEVLLEGVC